MDANKRYYEIADQLLEAGLAAAEPARNARHAAAFDRIRFYLNCVEARPAAFPNPWAIIRQIRALVEEGK